MQRQFVHRTDLKQNMLLIADSGFTCLHPQEIVTVEEAPKGRFFVMCACGFHYLNEQNHQIDARGFVTGLFRCEGLS